MHAIRQSTSSVGHTCCGAAAAINLTAAAMCCGSGGGKLMLSGTLDGGRAANVRRLPRLHACMVYRFYDCASRHRGLAQHHLLCMKYMR